MTPCKVEDAGREQNNHLTIAIIGTEKPGNHGEDPCARQHRSKGRTVKDEPQRLIIFAHRCLEMFESCTDKRALSRWTHAELMVGRTSNARISASGLHS